MELTEEDRKALTYAAMMWCVFHLKQKGHVAAAQTLLALVPREHAERALEAA